MLVFCFDGESPGRFRLQSISSSFCGSSDLSSRPKLGWVSLTHAQNRGRFVESKCWVLAPVQFSEPGSVGVYLSHACVVPGLVWDWTTVHILIWLHRPLLYCVCLTHGWLRLVHRFRGLISHWSIRKLPLRAPISRVHFPSLPWPDICGFSSSFSQHCCATHPRLGQTPNEKFKKLSLGRSFFPILTLLQNLPVLLTLQNPQYISLFLLLFVCLCWLFKETTSGSYVAILHLSTQPYIFIDTSILNWNKAII